jgi:hypothetical protein
MKLRGNKYVRNYAVLALSVIVVIAVMVEMFGRPPASQGDPIDQTLVLGIAVCSALAAIIQVVDTRSWTVRSVGLLYLFVGVGLFFGIVSYVSFTEDASHAEEIIDASRSFLSVGLPMLAIGLVAGVMGRIIRRINRGMPHDDSGQGTFKSDERLPVGGDPGSEESS